MIVTGTFGRNCRSEEELCAMSVKGNFDFCIGHRTKTDERKRRNYYWQARGQTQLHGPFPSSTAAYNDAQGVLK